MRKKLLVLPCCLALITLSACTSSSHSRAENIELLSPSAHTSPTASASTAENNTTTAAPPNGNNPSNAIPVSPSTPAAQQAPMTPQAVHIPSANNVTRGYATSLIADKRQDGKNVNESVINAYSQCVISRTYNTLSDTLKQEISSGIDDDLWHTTPAEDNSLDAAEDYCEDITPGYAD